MSERAVNRIFKAFWKRVKSDKKRFRNLFIGNLFIGLVGFWLSTLPFVKGNIISELAENLVFTLTVAFVNNLAAYYMDVVDEFIPESVSISALEGISQNSDMALYVSSTLKFNDWFHPELVKYLLYTSPLYRQSRSRAIRIFVLNSDANSELSIQGHAQEIAYRSLIYIHRALSIEYVRIDYLRMKLIVERVQESIRQSAQVPAIQGTQVPATQGTQSKSNFKGYDFCIGFQKPQNDPNKLIDIHPKKFTASCGACPISENSSEYGNIEEGETFILYQKIAVELFDTIFDDQGRIKLEFIINS